jgi:hypothetical protein
MNRNVSGCYEGSLMKELILSHYVRKSLLLGRQKKEDCSLTLARAKLK